MPRHQPSAPNARFIIRVHDHRCECPQPPALSHDSKRQLVERFSKLTIDQLVEPIPETPNVGFVEAIRTEKPPSNKGPLAATLDVEADLESRMIGPYRAPYDERRAPVLDYGRDQFAGANVEP